MLIASYGSLRKGMYKYNTIIDSYGQEAMKLKGTFRLDGFKMYDCATYPIACPSLTQLEIDLSGNTEVIKDSITVEVYEINSILADSIDRMEKKAGYRMIGVQIPIVATTGPPMRARMYIKDNPLPLVPNGDWVEHITHRISKRTYEDEEQTNI